jgi:serine/threonine protein kinase
MSSAPQPRFGKFTLLHRIATGGMGEVHLAKLRGPSGFEKLVVIKRLLETRKSTQHYIDMFFSEARVAAQLGHSNIVQIYEVGQVGEIHYIAMEYVQGKSLRRILDVAHTQRGFFPPTYCLDIFAELCAGLSFAHNAHHLSGASMGLIHRDVNPHNVLISYQGEVKIIDFGIAKSELTLEQTQAGTIKGTVVYMSPEQANGKRLDKRSDIFSVGICLYEALTGENPFFKDSVTASLEAIRQSKYTPLETGRPELLPFAPIVERALAANPAERFADCSDMGQQLRELREQNVLARPPLRLASYLQGLFDKDKAEEERLLSRTELVELGEVFREGEASPPAADPHTTQIRPGASPGSANQPLAKAPVAPAAVAAPPGPTPLGHDEATVPEQAGTDESPLAVPKPPAAPPDAITAERLQTVPRPDPPAALTGRPTQAVGRPSLPGLPGLIAKWAAPEGRPEVVQQAILRLQATEDQLQALGQAWWKRGREALRTTTPILQRQLAKAVAKQLASRRAKSVALAGSVVLCLGLLWLVLRPPSPEEVPDLSAQVPQNRALPHEPFTPPRPTAAAPASTDSPPTERPVLPAAGADLLPTAPTTPDGAGAAETIPETPVDSRPEPPAKPPTKGPSRGLAEAPPTPSHRSERPHRSRAATALPSLHAQLEPPVQWILNGTPVDGAQASLHAAHGTLQLGSGTDRQTDPFTIKLRYRLEGRNLVYSVESTPWANVSGPGGISLGRTPLLKLNATGSISLELHNPRQHRRQRINLNLSD